MLLSKRERPPDNSSSSSKASSISYRRRSIPSINPIVVPSVAALAPPRRAPLAPLDPQAASSMPLDDQASTTSSNSAGSHTPYSPVDLTKDADRSIESARPFIGRHIINRPPEEDSSPSLQLRKRSLSGHTSNIRSLPYPQPRLTTRRPSNTPPSGPRRLSIPGSHLPASSPSGLSLPSPPPHASVADLPPHSTPTTHLAGDDIYSGLSTFTFGAARPLPSPHSSDPGDMISPLTRVPGTNSADRTPRPSVSGPSGSGRHKPRSAKGTDPNEGDDEYEDEDDAARDRARSKMRAIDDGSRRPSLPTNVHVPQSSPSDPSSSVAAHELSPGGSSASESAFEESEADQDAEFDTDVELDLPQSSMATHARRGSRSSYHTFGPSGSDSFEHPRYRDEDNMSVDDSDNDSDAISPVTFIREQEEEALDDGGRPLPSIPSQAARKASLSWDIPTALGPSGDSSTLSRDREDSAATVIVRRTSRGVDGEATPVMLSIDGYPTSLPQTRAEFMSIEAQDPLRENEPISPQTEFTYGDYDINYILGTDPSSRKSWAGSSAPSYIQPGSSRSEVGDPAGLGAAWDAVFASGRRPSTVTVGSGDDAFARQVRRWDPDYTSRKDEWSFKKESTDGRGPHRMSLGNTAHSEIAQNTTMAPGTQELWRQAYIGRFKVDRVKMNPDQPSKAPQQRLNIRHIPDPYSKGNTLGGPGSVIHKHSRAVAFSIFRNHGLFSRTKRQNKQPMNTSVSILLANKKVQEQYTSTRTTSKLNSHGLLEDVGSMGGTSYSQTRTMVSSMHTRSRPTTPRSHRDGSQSDDYGSDHRRIPGGHTAHSPTPSGMEVSPRSTPPPAAPPRPSAHDPALSLSTVRSLDSETSGEGRAPQSEATDRSSTIFVHQPPAQKSSRGSDDLDDEDSPPRTSHAEAFATVDATYLEHMRGRPESRHLDEPSSHGLVGALRRRFLGSSKASSKTQSSIPPTTPRDGNYTPPWMTMAPRSKQEERERVIQNLNESFKDVGLLPTVRTKAGPSKGKRRPVNPTTIFERVPVDSLYMLLPLWPGETDPTSTSHEAHEDPASYFIAVEDRQYLLVYYVPFEDDKTKKADSNKKRARPDTRSIVTASSSTLTERIISLRQFRVCARLVSYSDLRETGVRVPAFGLSVTGSLKEAVRYLPPPVIRDQQLDDMVIGVCNGRHQGMEFIPEGLAKLGLCMPVEYPEMRMPLSETDIVEDPELILTPIGRAAVEMAWLGCLAVTSFGTI